MCVGHMWNMLYDFIFSKILIRMIENRIVLFKWRLESTQTNTTLSVSVNLIQIIWEKRRKN